MSRLQAQYQLHQGQISTIVSDITAKYQFAGTEFGYPGEGQDQQFETEDDHPRSEETCEHCDITKLVARSPRDSLTPRIHYGLIASGNQVMKHGGTRDKLARQYDFLCFEMEAAGLLDHFPCAVIRGISDYADSHKSKQWQPYAALTAAAYTRELLTIMPVGRWHTAQSMSLYRGESVKPQFSLVLARQSDSEKVIQKNLSSYDHEKVHRRLSHKRLSNTMQWFTNHPYFQAWLVESQSPYLWCTGKTFGSGKTIVAASVVDHVRSQPKKLQAPIVFFCCESDRPQALHASIILTSFINQMYHLLGLYAVPWGFDEVKRMIKTFFCPHRTEPDFEDMADIFLKITQPIKRAIYILDGLDSLTEHDIKRLIKLFRSLRYHGRSSARFLFFSRSYLPGNIDTAIAMPGVHQISTSRNVAHDIRTYIDESIAEKRMYKRLTDNVDVLCDIKSTLQAESSDVFLWVYLQLEIIWDTCETDEEIRLALSNLPPGLEETYHRCLQRIDFADVRALKVLKWVSFGSQPLWVDELREVAAFGTHDEKWDAERSPNKNFIVSCCANLVVEDPVDTSVRFAHPSVSQYLQKHSDGFPSWPGTPEQGQLECGEFCVSYLSFSDFCLQLERQNMQLIAAKIPDPGLLAREALLPSMVGKLFSWRLGKKQLDPINLPVIIRTKSTPSRAQYNFLDYATTNWALQTKNITPTSPVWDKFNRIALTFNDTWDFHSWIKGGHSLSSQVHALFGYAVRQHHMPLLRIAVEAGSGVCHANDLPLLGEGIPALHVAAKLGYVSAVQKLLEICPVNGLDSDGRTALHYAAETGNIEVVRLLANTKGVKVDIRSEAYHTPPWHAARGGRTRIASMLLDKGANAVPDPIPLLAAFEYGNIAVMVELLLRGANEQNYIVAVRKALERAVEMYNMEVVTELLKYVNLKQLEEDSIKSSLSLAAQEGHEAVAKLLIKKGSNTNALDPFDMTPLSWAVQGGKKGAAEFLIKNGAAVDGAGHSITPLNVAAQMGDETIATLLVQSGANVEDYGRTGMAPLSLAAQNGHLGVVRVLIQAKAHLEALDSQKRTALHLATCSEAKGCETVVEVLIKHKADLGAQDQEGRAPLVLAALQGRHRMVKILIKGGANMNTTSYKGLTPIALMVVEGEADGCEAVAKLLAENRADLNAKDKVGNSPLALAAMSERLGAESIAKLLLDYGASHELRNKCSQTPLSLASLHGQPAVADVLLAMGAALGARDESKHTPLALAAISESIEAVDIARVLLVNGAGIELRDQYGQTPLSLATQYGNAATAEVLIGMGAGLEARDMMGHTPLAWAAMGGHIGCDKAAKMLLWAGADIESKNSAGRTPLLLAAQYENDAVFQLLVNQGANQAAKDNTGRGYTALDLRLLPS